MANTLSRRKPKNRRRRNQELETHSASKMGSYLSKKGGGGGGVGTKIALGELLAASAIKLASDWSYSSTC